MRKVERFLEAHKATELAILIFIVLLEASSWFNSGLPKGQDALADISPASAARDSIFHYHSIPGWTDHWYLGYPLFYVSPPLLNCLRLCLSFPFGWAVASKLLYLLFFVLSGVFAYYYVYEVTKNRHASFFAGLIYTFASFHLAEAVFEGHHGIGAAYALTPLALLSIETAIKKPGSKSIVASGIFLALLILTHPQTFPLLVGPFLGLYALFCLCFVANKQRVKASAGIFSIFSLGLLLTAFWWFPLFWDIDYFHSAQFSLGSLATYNPTFLQLISLRPGSPCTPLTTYATSGSIFTQLLQLLPVALASMGLLLNYRNKYAWFFSVSALVGIFLAMGPASPINLYGLAYDHWPLFDRIRTPQRFLLFTCFAYAALAGLGIKSIVEGIKKTRPSVVILVVLSLFVIANTWQESRAAFESFELTQDQQEAQSWLSKQDEGRVMIIPMETWVYSPESRHIINPMCYTWLHGKDTVHGGVPALAPKWSGEFLEKIYWQWTAEAQRTNVGGVLDVLGVRYVMVDKTRPTSSNYVLDSSFVNMWESETIDIYRHEDAYPRVFTTTPTHVETIRVGDNWLWEGTQEAQITQSSEYVKAGDCSWRINYAFDKKVQDRFALGIPLQMQQDATAISFWYYLPHSLPNISLEVHLCESDGSKYFYDPIADMSKGCHKIEVPLSMFYLRWSEDENMHLDKSQVAHIWIGAYEIEDRKTPYKFSIYFSQISVIAEAMEEVDFTLIHPGKYQICINSMKPSRLILTESYYPGWVAKIDNQVIPSERIYGFLNGWNLDTVGEYELTLEFTKSWQRKLGEGLSFLALVGILLFFIGHRFKIRWQGKCKRYHGTFLG
jgi:hypothetical protein